MGTIAEAVLEDMANGQQNLCEKYSAKISLFPAAPPFFYLSNNNVLISPKDGNCIIIDIDSLVVPNMFPPEVIGTRGYIAPEVLATLSLENGPTSLIVTAKFVGRLEESSGSSTNTAFGPNAKKSFSPAETVE